MMAVGVLAAVVVVAIVVVPIAVYTVVRGEHDGREVMDRRDAERAARRDTRDRE